MEANYYKNWTDSLRAREKQKCNLHNEAIQLREKATSLLIQLQDLVHPKKWITLAEAKEFITTETNYLNELNNWKDYTFNPNRKTALEVDLNEESIIEQADEFLKNNQMDINSGDVNNVDNNTDLL